MTAEQPELEGMPPHSPVIRGTVDSLVDKLPAAVKVDDVFALTGVATVKRVGTESVGGKKRKYMQVHVVDVELGPHAG